MILKKLHHVALRCKDAGETVHRSSRRERHHHPHRLGGIGLRRSISGKPHGQNNHNQAQAVHCVVHKVSNS